MKAAFAAKSDHTDMEYFKAQSESSKAIAAQCRARAKFGRNGSKLQIPPGDSEPRDPESEPLEWESEPVEQYALALPRTEECTVCHLRDSHPPPKPQQLESLWFMSGGSLGQSVNTLLAASQEERHDCVTQMSCEGRAGADYAMSVDKFSSYLSTITQDEALTQYKKN